MLRYTFECVETNIQNNKDWCPEITTTKFATLRITLLSYFSVFKKLILMLHKIFKLYKITYYFWE